MENIYRTEDNILSTRKAFGEFTHIVVNRGYRIVRPIFFRTKMIEDLPLFLFQPWKPESKIQLSKWREKGGILIDASYNSKFIGHRDVTVIAEFPLSHELLCNINEYSSEYTVVNNPKSWSAHEDTIKLSAPKKEDVKNMWDQIRSACKENRNEVTKGSKFEGSKLVISDKELCEYMGVPELSVRKMRKSFREQEVWCASLRFKPEIPSHIKAWEQIEKCQYIDGEHIFTSLKGGSKLWRRDVKDMARLGNIGLMRYHVYDTKTPDWKKIEEKHKKVFSDFRDARSLSDELPFHLT